MSDRHERLAALRREVAEQDAAWAHAKEVLAVFGGNLVSVPTQALVELDERCPLATTGTIDFNAVRG